MAETKLPIGHRPPEHRVESTCDGCGVTDDHPKHVIAEVGGGTTTKHLQCCNCLSCVIHLDHAGDKRGLELAQHIQDNGDEIREKVERNTAHPDHESLWHANQIEATNAERERKRAAAGDDDDDEDDEPRSTRRGR